MRIHYITILVTCLLGVVSARFSSLQGECCCPKDKEQKRLEGVWQLLSCKVNGEDKTTPIEGMEIVFRKRAFIIKLGKKVTSEASFQIDPNTTPKSIEITNSGPEFQGKANLGIYMFKENKLWIVLAAAGEPRPEDFSCKRGSDHVLAVYVRKAD